VDDHGLSEADAWGPELEY